MRRNFAMISLLFLTVITPAAAVAAPVRHMIANVPQFDEITGLNCGPGALESVLGYWGPDIDQRELTNVARTSSIGTYVYDMVRAGHFSAQSAAQGRFFPYDIPWAGYTGRGLGFAAFGHAQATPWLEELKALVADNIPVILLMHFSVDPLSVGHYRVLVGYDDSKQEAYFIDPWGREFKHVTNPDGTVTWRYQDVITAWTYAAYGTEQPYFGAIILPWRVHLTAAEPLVAGKKIKISALAEYPCPHPFDCAGTPARDVTLHLQLPEGLRLAHGGAQRSFGEVAAGSTVGGQWTVIVDSPTTMPLSVTASGTVSGELPAAYWAGDQNYYPAYSYSDLIGGSASLVAVP